jgi:hypothetical protein
VWAPAAVHDRLRKGAASDSAEWVPILLAVQSGNRSLRAPAVAMTGVALDLASKENIARLLLACERGLAGEHRVEF